jgi:CHASE3 domain sensor protein
LTIYRKLLLSYLAMALLTVLASAYAIFSLQQLNRLAERSSTRTLSSSYQQKNDDRPSRSGERRETLPDPP